jgi:hypothetical protein
LHGVPDRDDRRRLGDASNRDGNRVDDEHGTGRMQARHRPKAQCWREKVRIPATKV